MRGTWREGSFNGDHKGYANKSLEMGVYFHRGPVLGNMAGCSFTGGFERRAKFLLYQENFYEEFERHAKEGSGNGQLSP
jgi:hypothetical protein